LIDSTFRTDVYSRHLAIAGSHGEDSGEICMSKWPEVAQRGAEESLAIERCFHGAVATAMGELD